MDPDNAVELCGFWFHTWMHNYGQVVFVFE